MSNCNTCTPAPLVTYDVQYFYNSNCFDCPDDCGTLTKSSCVVYKGPNLSCSGINTDDSIELSLQKIDEKLCMVIGDYSTYQFHCLGVQNTEADFVDAITSYVCTLRTDITELQSDISNITENVNTTLSSVTNPGITCSVANVTSEDSLVQILTKYCSKITDLQSQLSLNGVNWDQCFEASTPSTLAQAFQTIINMICQLKDEL